MRVAADVSALELADYQKAARLVLRYPLITSSYPDSSALPLVRRWVRQLRTDFGEILGYTILGSGDTIRLRRVQDTLDGTHPAVTRVRRPFDRRRYAYLVLALSALGRSGAQIALSELAGEVAADAGRIDGVGMDTDRKPDRDAFVDAVAWLEARGALKMADGSAVEWVNDPERAEALYDIDREAVGAIYAPSRVLQHLSSVTELLDGPGGLAGGTALAQGREARRRGNARRARRLVLEHPAVYYADVDSELRGQLRSAGLAEDIERLTGLGLERRAEGVALISAGQRFTDVPFPSTGTVAQAALLLCARIAGYLRHRSAKIERLPAATAAERLGLLAEETLLAGQAGRPGIGDAGTSSGSAEQDDGAESAYPFLSEVWLRTELRKLVDDFGAGMAEKQAADPGHLLAEAVRLLASMGLVAKVDGGVLVLPMLARYRSVTAQIKNPPPVTC